MMNDGDDYIHGRNMVEDFHLSHEAIKLAKRTAWGANTEMQVLAVGIQWGLDHAKQINPCECDIEVGFFCAHCCIENNYIQDLQNKFIALEAENARYREALELYADPWKHKEKIEDETSIPDFYGETDFGMFAREALKGEE